jgi:hypothetical protein
LKPGRKSICLITPHHISYQPRILREADSLYEQGHEVRVIFRKTDKMMAESDHHLMKTKKWRADFVDLQKNGHTWPQWFLQGVRSKLYQAMFNLGFKTIPVGAGAYLKGSEKLKQLALAEKADWFIAHTQGTLPAAAQAARKWGARLGFDCEDLLAENGIDPSPIVRLIEKEFLFLTN